MVIRLTTQRRGSGGAGAGVTMTQSPNLPESKSLSPAFIGRRLLFVLISLLFLCLVETISSIDNIIRYFFRFRLFLHR